ncbi:MAG: dTDP-glucose 4,6-dehydratase [Verrucomicrobiaceae bacterium]|nr:MAG: dTDP-glucose 4,6-dehydratase [Verrucomicrobiaceae bacterium]
MIPSPLFIYADAAYELPRVSIVPRSIIVTGGAGFIGSHLVRRLLADGHRVLNIDKLTYAGNLSSLGDAGGHPAHTFLQADIADTRAIHEAFSSFRPDLVFHLAAESHVDRSITGPMAFIETNVTGTATLLQASLEAWHRHPAPEDFRFIHVSTDEVFGALGDEGVFTENSPYQPRSPYSASKAASDHLVRAWGETYGLPFIITNSSNNYGPCQHPEKLIPLAITRALRGEPIPIYGNGTQVRDWLHVGDHCDALVRVAALGRNHETYLIGGGNEWRNLDLVHELCRILDGLSPRPGGGSYAEQITFVNDRPGHDFRYALDAAKIHQHTGWAPDTTRSEGFVSTVEWYLANRR